MRTTLANQQSAISQLEATVERLNSELASVKEEKELLEFEMIEQRGEKEQLEVNQIYIKYFKELNPVRKMCQKCIFLKIIEILMANSGVRTNSNMLISKNSISPTEPKPLFV